MKTMDIFPSYFLVYEYFHPNSLGRNDKKPNKFFLRLNIIAACFFMCDEIPLDIR